MPSKDGINKAKIIKRMIADLQVLLRDYEPESPDSTPFTSINRGAVQDVREQLTYLRQFHKDNWIALRIGTKPRQLKRWDTGYCMPSPEHKRKLKEIYYQEQKEQNNGW